MKFQRYLLLFLFATGHVPVFAQNTSALSKVLEKFTYRETNNPSSTLFLHCDKTLYTNNETIWFAAYLQANRGTPIEKHHTLSVSLLNGESGKIELSELYVMEAGLASGSILLPDTIPPGNYTLLAHTNIVDRKGMPLELFSIPLTIKSTLGGSFSASIRLLDTARHFAGTRRLSIRAGGIPIQKNGKYPPATISYYTAGSETRTVQTNGDGEAVVSIDPGTLNPSGNNIHASVSYGKEIRYLSLPLPVADPQKINIGFYPEGGNLSDGILSNVGFEARSAYGQPLALRAVLLRDGQPVDTVETSVSGMGRFGLLPVRGSIYTLKAFTSNLLARDTVYALPGIGRAVPVINMAKAVTGDTLSFTLTNALPGTFDIVVHNTHELLASFRVGADSRGRNVKIALGEVPKGIASVTVLDTMGNPLVERLFFAHYTEGELLSTVTDRPVYGPRERVTLKLRLKGTEAGGEEKGLVSVAAVQGNRIETAKFRDMESYTYLEHELGSLPLSATGMPYKDRRYLEDLLLVKGWRRFVFDQEQWPQKMDTVALYSSLEFSGRVTRNGKNINKPLALSVLRDTLFNFVHTDDTGKLLIKPSDMTVISGKDVFFSVNTMEKDQYKVIIDNPYHNLSNRLIKLKSQIPAQLNFLANNSTDQIYNSIGNKIQLKEVVISNVNNSNTYGTLKQKTKNVCGDYVCQQNILNCPNHPADAMSRVPENGKSYTTLKISNRTALYSSKRYNGCPVEISQSIFHSSKGRLIAKEFYNNDYKIDPDLSYQSTVYWNPLVELSSKKDTEVSFYTSDLRAPYRIIVQGVSEKQVVTGATTFKVE